MARVRVDAGICGFTTEIFRKPHETRVYQVLSPHLPHVSCPLYSGFLKAIEVAALLLTALLPAAVWSQQQPADLEHIRREFYRAVDQEEATLRLMRWIEAGFPGGFAAYPPVVQAYYASLEGLRGRHAANPFTKLDHVRRAIAWIDALPQRHPRYLEIRFLRFAFYHQLPALFGVRGRVGGDLAVLVGRLEAGPDAEVPPQVRRDMILYILESGEPDQEQRLRLSRLL